MKSSRLINEKQSTYSGGVLVGNWVEERVGRYKKNQFKHVSVYNKDFTPKYSTDKTENDEKRNDIHIKSDVGHIAPPAATDDASNYFHNYTTTYDLSFQYFPEWIHGTINRKIRFRLLKYEPTDEYLNAYGNLSARNNLTSDKNEEWACDVLDPRRPLTSIAKSDYVKYGSEAYKQHKWPRLHPVKIKSGAATDIVYKELPHNHPRTLEAKINPITWEGHDDKTSCVCKV